MNSNPFVQTIQTEMQQVKIPSCTYVVVNPTGIVASGALGYADIRQQKKATLQTSYHLFSATKVYTATAVMQLVEAGKLSLDASFTEILPAYRSDQLDAITVRHLLSHHSGLKDTLSAAVKVHLVGQPTPDTAEVLSRFKLKTSAQPEREVKYLNVNFAILGEIVSRCSGLPYADYIREHILEPLGVRASFGYTPAMQADLALGYLPGRDPLRFLLWLMMPKLAREILGKRVDGQVEIQPYELDSAAIGGLVGPVEEFAPFMIAQLNPGGGILTPESIRQMQSLVARGQAGFEAKLGVGLGWKIGEVDGQRFVNHEGSGAGFTTETRLYLNDQIGITLMMNRSGVDVHQAAHRICEQIRKARLGI